MSVTNMSTKGDTNFTHDVSLQDDTSVNEIATMCPSVEKKKKKKAYGRTSTGLK